MRSQFYRSITKVNMSSDTQLHCNIEALVCQPSVGTTCTNQQTNTVGGTSTLEPSTISQTRISWALWLITTLRDVQSIRYPDVYQIVINSQFSVYQELGSPTTRHSCDSCSPLQVYSYNYNSSTLSIVLKLKLTKQTFLSTELLNFIIVMDD